jgi:putative nucleotidyltransferase with HDIG domain
MLNRFKQVAAALTARVTAADHDFIRENLRAEERSLFYGMNLPDQRHALNVTYSALALARDKPGVDLGLLVKSALLHDVGKVRGDVSTLDKILTVIAHKLMPDWARRWGKYGRGTRLANFRHAVHIYFHHPERSAELLASVGAAQEVIGVVRRHHEAPQDDEPVELTILRQADDLH